MITANKINKTNCKFELTGGSIPPIPTKQNTLIESKICKTCLVPKELGEFYHHKAVCKTCLNKKSKIYREDNIEKIVETTKLWYEKTKIDRREHKANYYKIRRENDSLFALSSSLRRLIRTSISRFNYTKTGKTAEILGCSFEEFKNYIESKFEPWMTWENRGLYNGEFNFGWDIDHIIPLTKARNENEIFKLNHFSNLQPLCSKTNRDIKRDN